MRPCAPTTPRRSVSLSRPTERARCSASSSPASSDWGSLRQRDGEQPWRLDRRARRARRLPRGRHARGQRRSSGVSATTLAPVFAALSDDTRWQVLQELGRADLSASALASRLPVTRQAIAKHLAVLAEAGLVEPVRVGREVRYRPSGAPLGDRSSPRRDRRRVGPPPRRDQAHRGVAVTSARGALRGSAGGLPRASRAKRELVRPARRLVAASELCRAVARDDRSLS
ncbi:metalloregulator ArsR/SmtB family transcription factor [Oerskovia sp. M15]